MSQRGKKRSRKGGSTESKKSNSPSGEGPVFVQTTADNDTPSITLSPNLVELLHPLTSKEFLERYFRKRAVHVTCAKGKEKSHAQSRVSGLREEMFGLDPEMILRETSSDSIFLWLLGQEKKDGSKLIRSIDVSDVDTAISLHKIAGHATYCRAPPNVEQSLVASLLKATGLGCGQYDPSGESVISMGRGEVETFISTPGHVTNWHFDFQENFTIQLSGIKRWTIQSGTIHDPIRGCTPHYAAPEAVESQLKAAHLFDKKFRFGYPETGSTATGKVVSIDIKPGDVFYFPAGMWHKVETIEPGVSINVSLMANNYASVTCQALEHYLYRDSKWREPILNNDNKSAVDHLKALLKDLPSMIENLERNGGAQAILPPILTFPPRFETMGQDGDGQWEDANEDGDDESSGPKDEEMDDTASSRDGNSTAVVEEAEEESDGILDPYVFGSYPNEWAFNMKIGSSVKLTKNPLASLHRLDEITSFYDNDETDQYKNAFVLNMNYAGNEMHQSTVRVIFQDNKDGYAQDLYGRERTNLDEMISTKVTAGNLPYIKFLVFHGYHIIRENAQV